MSKIMEVIDNGGPMVDSIILGGCLLIIAACIFWPANRGL